MAVEFPLPNAIILQVGTTRQSLLGRPGGRYGWLVVWSITMVAFWFIWFMHHDDYDNPKH